MVLRILSIAGLVLGIVAGSAQAQTVSKIAVNSSIADGDGIAQRIVNAFQSDVTASAQYTMVSDERDANYIVEFASIVDDSDNNNVQQTSAYSVVLLDSKFQYVSSLVGVCGDQKTSSCAEHLFESVAGDIAKDLSPSNH
ncbi:MAG: hypothetical protein B7Z75_05555 [Acidocella sp. 20-57-95]|nr:MAG: hypothetical protein B7Z75_05555 [Acidocella sp. 20-57-95]HQT64589.1 hypothetical protein [Acidocella sp.]HQU04527.1 hypothetical protein [Acidocella sp.]